jgi:hypothetical protein
VGDPFKDTSSVALNPIIKFTTLFGLLAVELAVSLRRFLWRARIHDELDAGGCFLPDFELLRVPHCVVLRDAD